MALPICSRLLFGVVTPMPTLSNTWTLASFSTLMYPNWYQWFFPVNTHPMLSPAVGSDLNVTSPGFDESAGVDIPTVYFLEILASPCKNKEWVSIPFGEFDVILLLKITGPPNSEMIFLSAPPSTLIDLFKEISDDEITLNPTEESDSTISSPVTERTGVSKTSSWPVEELIFLFPM